MAKILDAKIDWAEKWDNSPKLMLLVDEFPNDADFLYRFNKGLWFARNKEGWVKFYSHDGSDENRNGFGGSSFTIKTKEGEKVLKGPWSSRASYANTIGFPLCLEVSITDKRGDFERGYTFFFGYNITFTVLKRVVKKFLLGCCILTQLEHGETSLKIALTNGKRKPNPETFFGKKENNWKEDFSPKAETLEKEKNLVLSVWFE